MMMNDEEQVQHAVEEKEKLFDTISKLEIKPARKKKIKTFLRKCAERLGIDIENPEKDASDTQILKRVASE